MRKTAVSTALACFMIVFLTGCWNSKEIQKMAYVTAIGLDYENGKYITYVQVLNFSNIARGETGEVGKNVPAWIGKGEGVTVTESFNSIYSTSQLRIFWGHVKAIVVSERFLKNSERVKEAYDMLNRYREVRYNILLYGTKEPLRDILSQKSILNLSPLDTLMDTYAQMYSQRSFILPTYGYKIIAQFNEPAVSATLPSLSIDRKSWSEDKRERPMFRIDGAYYFHAQQLTGWLSEKDLEGYRWLQTKLERSPINIPDNSSPDAAVVLIKPNVHFQYVVKHGKPYFSIHLTMMAYVDEMVRNLSKKQIEEKSAQVIKVQIIETYNKGLSIQADVLKLGEYLYRENPKLWQSLHHDGELIIEPDSLDSIDVKVTLMHTGKYKGRVD
ncbi:Ger(x)C family spore germination protein [Paenibacillus filicis]|uniref:Ger(X)C family spore germination protein n=1 Tax=Paenibacillus gyeongsangnamensis TaxID=3388067 RepID=A0ABT4QEX5_9BACL|nr:Ger(x)C family spore germination protein [Paenibacillus filicis]MCZ8515368.1 Ger(x)C family spore germination protein [Paenibacillus filicis]